jgi:hypothetical protein
MPDLHTSDSTRVRVDSAGRVVIPAELRQKLAIKPGEELGWQFVFASRQLSPCPRTGRLGRHHPASVQRAVAAAGREAGLRPWLTPLPRLLAGWSIESPNFSRIRTTKSEKEKEERKGKEKDAARS